MLHPLPPWIKTMTTTTTIAGQWIVTGHVLLARTRSKFNTNQVPDCIVMLRPSMQSVITLGADYIHEPALPELTRRFLFDQLNPNGPQTSSDIPLNQCPRISSKISVFHSAVATFYAPSDESGIWGMRRERIRSTPSWRGQGQRRDCAFVVEKEKEDKPGMKGLSVVHVRLFFSFEHNGKSYPCALVEWFKTIGRHPDAATGMWQVKPDYNQRRPLLTVVHRDSLLWGAHLIPVYGDEHSITLNTWRLAMQCTLSNKMPIRTSLVNLIKSRRMGRIVH